MKSLKLLVMMMCLVVAGLLCMPAVAAEPEAAYDIKTPGAHNPCYDRKDLWPEDVKQTAYYREKWEPARLLVWAGKKEGTIGPDDVKYPANWLEFPPAADGKGYGSARPASTPPDENTDVVIPDQQKSCTFDDGSGKYRHLTIGRNARFVLYTNDKALHAQTVSNVWVDGEFVVIHWNNIRNEEHLRPQHRQGRLEDPGGEQGRRCFGGVPGPYPVR